MPRVFAYCRVSTPDQTTDNQVQEIRARGFNLEDRYIFREVVSGAQEARKRPTFARLLEKLDKDDVLVVTKLDRLGRNAMDVRATIASLEELGVSVHCLNLGGMDLTSPAGKMTMQVLGAVAEFERDLLIERTQAGIARARKEGKPIGRPGALTAAEQEAVKERLGKGESVSAVAKALGVSRQTVMRVRDRAPMSSGV